MTLLDSRRDRMFPTLAASHIAGARRFASGDSRSFVPREIGRGNGLHRVFASGDSRAGSAKRVAAAAGEGPAVDAEIHSRPAA